MITRSGNHLQPTDLERVTEEHFYRVIQQADGYELIVSADLDTQHVV